MPASCPLCLHQAQSSHRNIWNCTNPVVIPRHVLAAGIILGRHVWSMIQHHEKKCFTALACIPRSRWPRVWPPPCWPRSCSALRVATLMLPVIITFCRRHFKLYFQFTKAWRREHKSHAWIFLAEYWAKKSIFICPKSENKLIHFRWRG